MDKVLFIFGLCFATLTFVDAELGACRFDTKQCSCKIGEENQGVCWDAVSGTPGACKRRFCKSGWTCACGGRTHVCFLEQRTALKVADADKDSDTAPCTSQQVTVTGNREISLGSLKLHISGKGAASNECLELAWWHNGELMGNYKPVDSLEASQVSEQLQIREQHSSMELRGGDVLGWRYRDGSYYCQKRRVEMVVNGTSIDLNTPGVQIMYSRAFSTGWFNPDFVPVVGENEEDSNIQSFLPLRTVMSDGTTVTPDGDFFQPFNSATIDHAAGNFYFRLVLPHNLTTTYENPPAADGASPDAQIEV